VFRKEPNIEVKEIKFDPESKVKVKDTPLTPEAKLQTCLKQIMYVYLKDKYTGLTEEMTAEVAERIALTVPSLIQRAKQEVEKVWTDNNPAKIAQEIPT
jgi:hypothetical protein